MQQLILVSHGAFAVELKKSAEMILGPLENIHTVSLLPEEGPEDFLNKFLQETEPFSDFIVFSDLLGGTPCNSLSGLLLKGANFDLYAGMNLPMVISFVNGQMLGEVPDYVTETQAGVLQVNQRLQQLSDADFDEDE